MIFFTSINLIFNNGWIKILIDWLIDWSMSVGEERDSYRGQLSEKQAETENLAAQIQTLQVYQEYIVCLDAV